MYAAVASLDLASDAIPPVRGRRTWTAGRAKAARVAFFVCVTESEPERGRSDREVFDLATCGQRRLERFRPQAAPAPRISGGSVAVFGSTLLPLAPPDLGELAAQVGYRQADCDIKMLSDLRYGFVLFLLARGFDCLFETAFG